MLVDHLKFQPLYQAADEGAGGAVEGDAGGTPDAGGGAPPPGGGPGSGRSELRSQLEKNFDTDRKQSAKREAGATKVVRRVAGGAEIEPEAPEAAAGAEKGAVEGAGAPAVTAPAVAAPDGFSAEAKAAWGTTPPVIQEAITKRLNESAKGVEELKNKYGQLDQALAPHLEAIRAINQTPAQAIHQLFSWFQALGANPKVAFPALVQSFNLRPEDVFGFQPQTPDPAADGAPAEGDIPPSVQKYITEQQGRIAQLEQSLNQKIGGLESTFARESQAKTDEILATWSVGKPHFASVRQMMANLISSGTVPLKDGKVDLDGAYDMAIYANPAVRQQVLTAQQEAQKKEAAAKVAAEKKAQQDAADKARRAGVSVSGAAPGAPGAPSKPVGKRKSVRESINDAMTQLTD